MDIAGAQPIAVAARYGVGALPLAVIDDVVGTAAVGVAGEGHPGQDHILDHRLYEELMAAWKFGHRPSDFRAGVGQVFGSDMEPGGERAGHGAIGGIFLCRG